MWCDIGHLLHLIVNDYQVRLLCRKRMQFTCEKWTLQTWRYWLELLLWSLSKGDTRFLFHRQTFVNMLFIWFCTHRVPDCKKCIQYHNMIISCSTMVPWCLIVIVDNLSVERFFLIWGFVAKFLVTKMLAQNFYLMF